MQFVFEAFLRLKIYPGVNCRRRTY